MSKHESSLKQKQKHCKKTKALMEVKANKLRLQDQVI